MTSQDEVYHREVVLWIEATACLPILCSLLAPILLLR